MGIKGCTDKGGELFTSRNVALGGGMIAAALATIAASVAVFTILASLGVNVGFFNALRVMTLPGGLFLATLSGVTLYIDYALLKGVGKPQGKPATKSSSSAVTSSDSVSSVSASSVSASSVSASLSRSDEGSDSNSDSVTDPTLFFLAADPTEELTLDHLQVFQARGGVLEVLQERGDLLRLEHYETFSVGCDDGEMYSQVLRVFLLEHRCKVREVIAGVTSGFNPSTPDAKLRPLSDKRDAWYQDGGYHQRERLGELNDDDDDDGFDESPFDYSGYATAVDPTHYLCFGQCGPSLVRRLLEREGDLSGFRITLLPWNSIQPSVYELSHPIRPNRGESLTPSQESRNANCIQAIRSSPEMRLFDQLRQRILFPKREDRDSDQILNSLPK